MTAPDPRLGEIEARLSKATPGPWTWSEETDEWGDCGPNLETVKRGPVYSDGSQGADETVIGSWGHDANGISVDPSDAEFIAAAPADVAYLLAELRKSRLRTQRVAAVGTRYLAELRKAQDALGRVEGLHFAEGDPDHSYADICFECRDTYPCPTMAAVAAATGGERG